MAVDVVTGEELWRERAFGWSQIVYADRILILDEDGDLGLATATREGLNVHAKAERLTANAWAPADSRWHQAVCAGSEEYPGLGSR